MTETCNKNNILIDELILSTFQFICYLLEV
jgi:hypothetical protein